MSELQVVSGHKCPAVAAHSKSSPELQSPSPSAPSPAALGVVAVVVTGVLGVVAVVVLGVGEKKRRIPMLATAPVWNEGAASGVAAEPVGVGTLDVDGVVRRVLV